MLPYPKPITLLSRENQKELKAEFTDAEMNLGMALPINDIRPATNVESDIFPKGKNEELFTPPEGSTHPVDNNKFFITEDDAIQERKEEYQDER